jgi:hypothetical protein
MKNNMPNSRPRGVGQLVMECVVKALRDVKVTGSKPTGTKKNSHVKCNIPL